MLSVDLALGMLLEQRRLGSAVNVTANAIICRLQMGLDCIVSNLMLQWILDPLTCFAECRRVFSGLGCLL